MAGESTNARDRLDEENGPAAFPSKRRLINQLAMGLVWLALLSALAAGLTDAPLAAVFVVLLSGSLCLSGLTVYWMASWASRADARLNSFSISSLLLVTLFAGVFLALLRWLVLGTAQKLGHPEPIPAAGFLISGAGLLLVCLISIPQILGLFNSLLWISAGVLQSPWVRRARLWFGRRAKSKN
jgi:hypothetical protein